MHLNGVFIEVPNILFENDACEMSIALEWPLFNRKNVNPSESIFNFVDPSVDQVSFSGYQREFVRLEMVAHFSILKVLSLFKMLLRDHRDNLLI